MTDVVSNRVQWNRYGRQPGQPFIRTNLQQYLETVPSDKELERLALLDAEQAQKSMNYLVELWALPLHNRDCV
jgi:hypothetical protein